MRIYVINSDRYLLLLLILDPQIEIQELFVHVARNIYVHYLVYLP